jgi:hypothetical protein
VSRTRIVLLVVLAALVGIWASSSPSMTPMGRAGVSPLPLASSRRTPEVFDMQVTTERLEARRAQGELPAEERRNPFRFAVDQRAPREPQQAQAATLPLAAGAATAATLPTLPPMSLIGIVDRTVDGRAQRLAVVSMADTLYYAAAGARIGSRYEVVSVAADAVELKDLSDGSTRRVALK